MLLTSFQTENDDGKEAVVPIGLMKSQTVKGVAQKVRLRQTDSKDRGARTQGRDLPINLG